MNERAELLVQLLQERYGLQITETIARETVSDQVDLVAELMRIGRQAAKVYVTDDKISEIADRIGTAVLEHRAHGGPAKPAGRRVTHF